MHVAAVSTLVCPIDGAALATAGATLRCGHGHAFDRAREGYVNLLVVQHKASRDPGDSKAMVAARRRVLDSGIYAPIADAVFACVGGLVGARVRGAPPFRVLDAGCGEGYTLARLSADAAASADPAHIELAGIDVSKWAVRAAAKRGSPDGGPLPVAFAVANNRHLPFAAASLDLILAMFGFAVWEGFAPAQPVGARVLLVDPGPAHLIELREIIYPAVTRSPPPSLERAAAAGYTLESEQTLTFPAHLPDAAAIADLLAMTPHAHRMTDSGRAALAHVTRLAVTCNVVLRCLRKT